MWLVRRSPGSGARSRRSATCVALAGLTRLMRAWRPQVVHTHTAKAGLLGRLAARAARVPTVVHTFHGHVLRGYFAPPKQALFRRLEALLARAADALVAVSDAVKQDLVELGVARADKIRVIPLGLELGPLAGELPRGALRREAGLADGTPLVGMVGRLVPIKDVPTFLRAARLVLETRPAVRFALVGDGEERAALESLCGSLGLAGHVHFFGWRRELAPGLRRPRRGGERLAQRGHAGGADRGAGRRAPGGRDRGRRHARPARRRRARTAGAGRRARGAGAGDPGDARPAGAGRPARAARAART